MCLCASVANFCLSLFFGNWAGEIWLSFPPCGLKALAQLLPVLSMMTTLLRARNMPESEFYKFRVRDGGGLMRNLLKWIWISLWKKSIDGIRDSMLLRNIRNRDEWKWETLYIQVWNELPNLKKAHKITKWPNINNLTFSDISYFLKYKNNLSRE